MKTKDQIIFQVKTSAEGKNRVFLKSWEDNDGSATLASVIASDFRLTADGEGLADALTRIHELDKRYEKSSNTTNKEAKAAHRRMDQAFPTMDTKLLSLEARLAQVNNAVESLKSHVNALTESILKVEKNLAQLNYENEQFTDLIVTLEESTKSNEAMIEDLQTDISVARKDVVDLRKFNDKVVLFYTEDEGAEATA